MINMDISDKEIKPEYLPELVEQQGIMRQLEDGEIIINLNGKNWEQVKKEFETKVISYFLSKRKSKTEVAKDLGITRRALYKKLKLLESNETTE
jgi:transcriptional regulator with PAS, ATPase and Fis domain